jgi:hypothetical protein
MNLLAFVVAQQDARDPGAGGILGLFFGGMCVVWLLVLAATVFWLWMLVDALVNELTPNDKILWFLVIFFLHFIGALIYLFVRRGQRRPAAAP